jgi:hypothetical protein
MFIAAAEKAAALAEAAAAAEKENEETIDTFGLENDIKTLGAGTVA